MLEGPVRIILNNHFDNISSCHLLSICYCVESLVVVLHLIFHQIDILRVIKKFSSIKLCLAKWVLHSINHHSIVFGLGAIQRMFLGRLRLTDCHLINHVHSLVSLGFRGYLRPVDEVNRVDFYWICILILALLDNSLDVELIPDYVLICLYVFVFVLLLQKRDLL